MYSPISFRKEITLRRWNLRFEGNRVKEEKRLFSSRNVFVFERKESKENEEASSESDLKGISIYVCMDVCTLHVTPLCPVKSCQYDTCARAHTHARDYYQLLTRKRLTNAKEKYNNPIHYSLFGEFMLWLSNRY